MESRRISLISLVLSFTVFATNCFTLLSRGEFSFLLPNIIGTLVPVLVFGVLLILPIKFEQIIQTILFILIGVIVAADQTDQQFVSVIIFVIAFSMAYKYKLLDKYFRTKIIIIGTAIIVFLIGKGLMSDSLGKSINMISFLLVAVSYVFILFTKDLKRIKYEMDLKRNMAEIGESTSQVIHSSKAILSVLTSLKEEVLPDNEMGELFKKAIENLETNFKHILLYGKTTSDEIEEINVKDLALAIAHVLGAQRLSGNRLIPIIVESENTIARINAYDLKTIVENLVKNSMEELISKRDGKIVISVYKDSISVSDNGSGIETCSTCVSHYCNNCQRFKIGSTTKENGSGFGVRNVIDTCKKNGWLVKFKRHEAGGTTITIFWNNQKKV